MVATLANIMVTFDNITTTLEGVMAMLAKMWEKQEVLRDVAMDVPPPPLLVTLPPLPMSPPPITVLPLASPLVTSREEKEVMVILRVSSPCHQLA